MKEVLRRDKAKDPHPAHLPTRPDGDDAPAPFRGVKPPRFTTTAPTAKAACKVEKRLTMSVEISASARDPQETPRTSRTSSSASSSTHHPRTPPHRDEKHLIEIEKRYFGKLSFRADRPSTRAVQDRGTSPPTRSWPASAAPPPDASAPCRAANTAAPAPGTSPGRANQALEPRAWAPTAPLMLWIWIGSAL